MIVGLVRETAAVERLGEEGDPRLLEEEIAELLGDGKPRTRDEISTKSKGGIGARKEAVEACLTGNAHLFRSVPGNEVGRSARATVWLLAPGVGASRGEYVSRRIGEPAPADPLPFGEGGGASRPPNSPAPPGATDLSLLPDEATDSHTFEAASEEGTSSASDATPAPSDEERQREFDRLYPRRGPDAT
jgi:hypothetical protein